MLVLVLVLARALLVLQGVLVPVRVPVLVLEH
jgi:hypothetical protein